MAEYYEFGTNINYMFNTLGEHGINIQDYLRFTQKPAEKEVITPPPSPKKAVDPDLLEVRNSICVVGHNWQTVQKVKHSIAALVEDCLPLESLHVKISTDLKDGALHVPKVVLVASHIPGKKLLDEDGDEGLLDVIYDAVCDIKADVLVVYLNLPRAIYPPVRNMVFHPRMAELLFPSQPVLRNLAENHSLITVVEKTGFTNMQRNVIREWMLRPVISDHPVYAAASRLIDLSFSEAEFWSESEILHYQKPVPYHSRTYCLSAAESYSTTQDTQDAERKKKRKKRAKALKAKQKDPEVGVLISLDDNDPSENVELEMYNHEEFSARGQHVVGNIAL